MVQVLSIVLGVELGESSTGVKPFVQALTQPTSSPGQDSLLGGAHWWASARFLEFWGSVNVGSMAVDQGRKRNAAGSGPGQDPRPLSRSTGSLQGTKGRGPGASPKFSLGDSVRASYMDLRHDHEAALKRIEEERQRTEGTQAEVARAWGAIQVLKEEAQLQKEENGSQKIELERAKEDLRFAEEAKRAALQENDFAARRLAEVTREFHTLTGKLPKFSPAPRSAGQALANGPRVRVRP